MTAAPRIGFPRPPAEVVPLPVVQRPRTRADCAEGPRPCPWVTCRWHLLIRIGRAGALRLNRAAALPADGRPIEAWSGDEVVAAIESLPHSCTLDAAARGPNTLERVGEILGITREGVRVAELSGIRRLRRRGGLP